MVGERTNLSKFPTESLYCSLRRTMNGLLPPLHHVTNILAVNQLNDKVLYIIVWTQGSVVGYSD